MVCLRASVALVIAVLLTGCAAAPVVVAGVAAKGVSQGASSAGGDMVEVTVEVSDASLSSDQQRMDDAGVV